MINKQNRTVVWVLGALAVAILPLLLQAAGNFWVRIADTALLYVLLALGLNIVVGYAGLLDLGFVAFFAIGAYMYGLMASPHLSENFPWFATMFPEGVHASLWLVIPAGAALAGFFGILLGLIESIGSGYIGTLTGGVLGSNYSDIFAFIVLIVVLTLRPSGLLGERVADRA